MKRLEHCVLLLASLLLFCSCNEESWQGLPGNGGIRLKLQTSGNVEVAAPVLRSEGSIDVPDTELFGIRLEKSDGSLNKTWSNLENFSKEKGFSAGQYNITAFYGDINKEGFESPCFIGTEEIYVIEDKQTDVEITASLANSMVSVDYTDAFRNYFSSWQAQVHSEGHDFIDFASDEVRPAFLAPGEVAVSLTMTNQTGKTVTLQPASFMAEARHHYRLTFDVNNGEVGNSQLVIKFDDSLVQEDVNIDLTEELFTTPAPEVKGYGFSDGDVIEALEGNVSAPCKLQILARGGLQGVTLTVNSADYTPEFGNEIELMSASQLARRQLEEAGVECVGLWNNPDRMATVDLTKFCSRLPAGKHVLTLQAKDRFTRVSQPIGMTVNVSAVTMSASAQSIVLGNEEAVVSIKYNGTDPEGSFSFQVLDNRGNYIAAPIKKVEEQQTRSFEEKTYNFTIQVPQTERADLPIAVYYHHKLVSTIKAHVVTPDYEVSIDPLSTQADVSVITEDASTLKGIVSMVKLYVGGALVPESNILRDVANGRVTVKGLTASTQYHLQTTLLQGGAYVTDQNFTTDAEAPVPNGDFEELSSFLSNVTINQGGPWSDLGHWAQQQSQEAFNVSEPVGWATVNAKTFNNSISDKGRNTWFLYPSTINVSGYSGGTAMLLQSVGYDYEGNGKVPGRDTNTGTQPYSDKVASVDNRAAGKLFLGSYSIDYSTMAETYSEGVAFSARPVSLKGVYKYVACAANSSDKGTVSVKLYNGSQLVAQGTKEFGASSDFASFEVPLTYEIRGMRPTHLHIMFCSTKDASSSVSAETANVKCDALATQQHQSYIGSKLTVDNLTFSYGEPKYKAGAKKVVIRKKNIRRK